MDPLSPLFSMAVFLAVFGSICALGFAVFMRSYGDRRRAVARLRELAEGEGEGEGKGHDALTAAAQPVKSFGELAWMVLHQLGRQVMPQDEDRLAYRKQQLLQAGYYGSKALRVYSGAQFILMLLVPAALVLPPYSLGFLSGRWALVASVVASSVGMLAPNLWLRSRVKERQRQLRAALPDALDMLVLCMDGGVSLVAAFQRVTAELQVVHPVLGAEMNIVQREIQLGLSPGAALKKLGERCGLADVRDLASVLLQSERYGASMVKAVRTYSESWRQERQNLAEERAQKAAVKILFPTLLCIFPAIFIVLLGPASFQIAQLFSK
jgi:tight adherence protein C